MSRGYPDFYEHSFDSSPRMGDELPGPAELLCSAFAACVLKNVGHCNGSFAG